MHSSTKNNRKKSHNPLLLIRWLIRPIIMCNELYMLRSCSAYSSAAQAANWNRRRGETAIQDATKTCAQGWSAGPAAMDKYDRGNTGPRFRGTSFTKKNWGGIHLFYIEFLPNYIREEWVSFDNAFWEEIDRLRLTKCIVPPGLGDRRCSLTTLLARSLWSSEGWCCCHTTLSLRLS